MSPNQASSSRVTRLISYEEITNDNVLTSHREFKAWRVALFQYLRQEGLEYVLHERPLVPVGRNVEPQDRAWWIKRLLDEATVKSILLHTTPLENFKAYKEQSAYDIFKTVSRECAVDAKRAAELSGRRKMKGKEDAGEGEE